MEYKFANRNHIDLRSANRLGDKPVPFKDGTDENSKDKTLELLDLVGHKPKSIDEVSTDVQAHHAVVASTFEAEMKATVEDYDEILKEGVSILGPSRKSLKQRWLARTLVARIGDDNPAETVIPETIRRIVDAVKNLEFGGSILRRPE